MSMFRRRTIFHAEEAMPDPEDLKLRFRRRVLLLALVGFLVVLGIPVAHEIQGDLQARASTRRLAEEILTTRTLASIARVPVSLTLEQDDHSWRREFHAANAQNCGEAVQGPHGAWEAPEVFWKLQAQKPTGETVSGRSLCLHPTKGIELDSTPIEESSLLITGSRKSDEGQMEEAAYLIVSQFGADIQALYSAKR